ncbi:Fe-S cluster assembly transcriptional regulator IscR [Thiohalocapsa marina]|uniref:Fe-S cluster assembly transcriptional regulator IscR n=1 Tax=Thiohalocapsa marina TaxID=424902 RepID=A0A5M8FG19_9GAMM|nr:Fe-S cluster assembly transcriptional regulator IscR [Thiohalocapsa marina]KAA6183649.1 Fe-S cluster assembly transcriptional regulator IscR [Thiohalocapsa marina]
MRLTTKGRYAVTAVLDLAIHGGQGPISLADIADRQGISLSYLEQLFAKLRKRGLVASVRGPGGGYHLAREASTISIAAVITAVDENIDTTRCGGEGNCKDSGPCLTHGLWMDLSERIHDYLSHISVQDLVDRRPDHEAEASAEPRRRAGGARSAAAVAVPIKPSRDDASLHT